jgi:hypothetical protein
MAVIITRSGQHYVERIPAIETSVDEFNNIIECWKGSPLHCTTGPAIIDDDGTELYYCDGIQFTKEAFAERAKISPHYRILPSGAKQRIWKDLATNKIHRTDGPAIETSDGSYTAWMIDGRLHRIGGPAETIATPLSQEERFYCNGKLHNTDGPAKTNDLTGSASYYINGKRITKKEFMIKQKSRAKIRATIDMKKCYALYKDAYEYFKQNIIAKKYYDNAASIYVQDFVRRANMINGESARRAAALGIYHAMGQELVDEKYFNDMYAYITDEDSQGIYVMDEYNLNDYEIYLSTYMINSLHSSSIFTTFDANQHVSDIISAAVERVGELLPAKTYAEFCGAREDDSVSDDNIFSWALPLALAAGIGMLGQARKHKKTKLKTLAEKENEWKSEARKK